MKKNTSHKKTSSSQVKTASGKKSTSTKKNSQKIISSSQKLSRYDHTKIEKKWQKIWDDEQVYKTLSAKDALRKKMKPYYVLDMFPYPSGAGLHVGHPRGYIASDIFARMKRMSGFNVLHPMGFDSFGLPAEQYAIQTGKNPGPFTNELVKKYRKQLSILGFSYDWDRQVATHDPEYYRWTQWIFLQIYNSWYDRSKNKARPITDLEKEFVKNGNEKVSAVCDSSTPSFSKSDWKNFSDLEKQQMLMKYRLAYEGYAEVNWCPEMGTVLANDEVIEKEGKMVSERGEFPVEKKQMRQWFMRITAYADRLLEGLETIDWSQSIKEIQKNWIGKSEGSEIEFKISTDSDPSLTLPKGKGTAPGYLTTDAKTYKKLQEKVLEMRKNPTQAEDLLWKILKGNTLGYHFRRQHIISHFIADFVCLEKKLIIEVDGDIHNSLKDRDEERTKQLELLGFHVIRFQNDEIKNNINNVIEKIKNTLENNLVLLPSLWEGSGMGCKVFTTRADTLFGVTYVVLAPEHHLVTELSSHIKNWNEVQQYLTSLASKSDEDRIAAKEKTGVPLQGIFAINPANGEQVPVWIADYVLANYGTGAVMAVPAHDERDFEFAQKYNLPIKHVIARPAQEIPQKEIIRRDGAVSLVINKKGEILVLQREDKKTEYLFPQGGIESGEDPLISAIREVREESGYVNVSLISELGVHENYFEMKESTRHRITHTYLFNLNSDENHGLDLDEGEVSFIAHWMTPKEALEKINTRNHKLFLELFINHNKRVFTEKGILVNSGSFNDMTSEEARKAITEFVGGKLVTQYKMRDAIFARQRYWGEPIPLVHQKGGLLETVSEKKLPLTLPQVKSYAPSGNGEGPLATVKSWVDAGYETNTMPGWAGSSWYFLRYTDPTNQKKIANEIELDYWFGKKGGVHMYVGGSEHATGHLLYSRFWHKVLKDLGYVKSEEPFQTLRNQGLIMGPDGRKMSKRWGNIINPDDVVRDMGADTLRVYEAFMGPFESSQPWSTDGIVGARRFIERVWNLQSRINDTQTAPELEKVIHKTIKKVTEDIVQFGFNTAVSSMMICMNEIEKHGSLHRNDFKAFLKLLAPFAPHITEELWERVTHTSVATKKQSIHVAAWPTYQAQKVIDATVSLGIQVNGKVRAEITLLQNASHDEVRSQVFALPEIIKWVDGKEIKKFIYIPGKIISIVI